MKKTTNKIVIDGVKVELRRSLTITKEKKSFFARLRSNFKNLFNKKNKAVNQIEPLISEVPKRASEESIKKPVENESIHENLRSDFNDRDSSGNEYDVLSPNQGEETNKKPEPIATSDHENDSLKNIYATVDSKHIENKRLQREVKELTLENQKLKKELDKHKQIIDKRADRRLNRKSIQKIKLTQGTTVPIENQSVQEKIARFNQAMSR